MAVDNSVSDLTLPLDDIHIEKDYLLGRGGYGRVYRGYHDNLGLVAVKLMIEGGSLPNRQIRDLKREAERLKIATNHPNIVNLHGALMEREHYGLVLEYMHFGSVTDFVKDYTVDISLKVRITSQVISAMDYLHGYNPPIQHLDMKADNVLIDNHLNAKICDFGLSEWKTVTVTVTRGITSTPSRPCTITHICPEVLRDINLKSNTTFDVFAFGITIWEIFSGQSPYGNHSDDLIRQSVLNDQRPDLSLLTDDCPVDIRMLMIRCWNGTPAVRPTFAALKTEIRPLMSRYEKLVPRAMVSIRHQVKEKFCVNDEEYSGTDHLDELEVMEDDDTAVEADPAVQSLEAPMEVDTAKDATEADAAMELENESRTTSDTGNRSIPVRHPLKMVYPENLSMYEESFRKVLRSPLAMEVINSNVGESLQCTIDGRNTLKSCEKIRKHLDTDTNLRYDLMTSNVPFLANLNNPKLADGIKHSRSIQKDRQASSDLSVLQKHADRNSVSRSERESKINSNRSSMQRCKYSQKLQKNDIGQKLAKALKEPYFMNDEIMKDRAKGGGKSESGEKFDTVDPKVIEAAKDPFLLQIVLSRDKQLLDHLMRNYALMMMKLIAENKTQYKSPTELREEEERRRRYENERKMEKERDRMRDRMRYMGRRDFYGYWDDDDDEDIDLEDNRRMMRKGYPDMRKHARHPMMGYMYDDHRVGMPMELFMRGPNHQESAMKRKQKDKDVRNLVRDAKDMETERRETFRIERLARMEEEQKKRVKQFKEEKQKKDKMEEDIKKKAGAFSGLVGVFNKKKQTSLFDSQKETHHSSMSGLPSNEVDQGSMDPDITATTSPGRQRAVPVPPRSEPFQQDPAVVTSAPPGGQMFQPVGPPGYLYPGASSAMADTKPTALETKGLTQLNLTPSQQPTQKQSFNLQPMEVEPSPTQSVKNEPVSFARSLSTSSSSSTPPSPRVFGTESPSSKKSSAEFKSDVKNESDKKSSSTGSSSDKAGAPLTISHKHVDGGYTKLTFTNGNVKPNLQVGNQNVMIVGGGGNSSGAKSLDEEAELKKKKPKKKNVNLTKSQKMLDMDQIDMIASDIGKECKRLCRQMGLSDAEVEHIEQDYHINGTYEIMYQGISRWNQKNGRAATVQKMAEYLYDMDRLDLAKKLK